MGGSASIADIVGVSATLAATLLGGGGAVVPLELSVRETGYVLAPVLFVTGACWTLYSSWALLKVSHLTQEDSYESAALRTLGKMGSYIVQGVIILNNFLICVSIQGLFVDLMGPILERSTMVILSGVAALPMTAGIRRVERLAPLSIITALTAVVFAGFVVARFAMGPLPTRHIAPGPSGSKPATVWLDGFSTMVIAFVVQFNVLPLFASLPPVNAQGSMMAALLLGLGLSLLLYLTMDLCSYLTFGGLDYVSTLDAYMAMGGGGAATNVFGIGQLLSYPILAYSAVGESGKILLGLWQSLNPGARPKPPNEKSTLLIGGEKGKGAAAAATASSTSAPAATLDPKAGPGAAGRAASEAQTAFIAERLAAVLWVLCTTVLAFLVPDVSSLLAVVGASCATPLMTIFPPLMLLRCEANKGDPLRPLHAVLCGLGCLMTCAGLVVSIMDFGGADDALPPTSEATWDYSSWIRFRSSSVFAAPSERPV